MPGHILLVEDSPTQARFTGMILEEAGYQVSVADHGELALEMAGSINPDLIILDVMLPDLDGYSVCRRLRQDLLTYIPILMLTERKGLDDKIDGLETGADDYLTKPFEERELLARLVSLLRIKQLLSDLLVRLKQGQQNYQMLRRIALTDQLTGLYNRHYFAEMLEREFHLAKRYNSQLACIMSDLDNFRTFNNTYGHPVGDIILQKTAYAIRDNLRQGDILARYGGEEFVVLLPHTSLEAAITSAERIRQVVETTPCETAKGILHVTLSLGVASITQICGDVPLELIECADQALYQAKRQGRNRVCVFKTI